MEIFYHHCGQIVASVMVRMRADHLEWLFAICINLVLIDTLKIFLKSALSISIVSDNNVKGSQLVVVEGTVVATRN